MYRTHSPRDSTGSDFRSCNEEDYATSSEDDDDNGIDGGSPLPASPAEIPKLAAKPANQPKLLDQLTSNTDFAQSTTSTLARTVNTWPAYTVPLPHSSARKVQQEARRQALAHHKNFIEAVKNNQILEYQTLLDAGVNINKPGPDGLTALHHAAWKGHEVLVLRLIEQKADLNARTPQGDTPLMLAVKKRQAVAVEILIYFRKTADVSDTTASTSASSSDASPPTTTTPFMRAAEKFAAMQDEDRLNLMLTAVSTGDLASAASMIAAGGMNLEELDTENRTMLALAAIHGDPEMIELLLCAGAKIDALDLFGNTPLMHAVKMKQAAAVSVLMTGGAMTAQTNDDGKCALSLAVDSDDLDVLKALIDNRAGAWQVPSGKEPLIHMAACAGRVEMTRWLLERQAYTLDERGSRTLAVMARKGEQAAIDTLLKAGADPHHKDWDGHTAFTLAAANGHTGAINVLIKHCPPRVRQETWTQRLQDHADNQGRTALMLAVLNRQLKMTSLLLEEKADPHRADRNGRNAILWAAAKGDAPIITVLIGHHATHVATDLHGNTVFLTAAEHDNTKALKLFCMPHYINSMFNVNSPNKDGDTPLLVAARNGHLKAVDLLLKNGANLLQYNKLGRTALHEASLNGHTLIVAKLQDRELALPMTHPAIYSMVKAIASVFPPMKLFLPGFDTPRTRPADHEGNSVMHLAASQGHRALMGSLLASSAPQPIRIEAHASSTQDGDTFVVINTPAGELISPLTMMDIETTNNDGMTPLAMAARNGHYSTVKLLIDQGADVNHAGAGNSTPLWLACRLTACAPEHGVQGASAGPQPSIEDLISLLLAHDAVPDQVSTRGQTPLIAASIAGTLHVVQHLISIGADVHRADALGLTSLMHAAHFGHMDIVKTLLDMRAAPDPAPGRISALILAAKGGHDEVVRLLIERGAQPNHVNENSATALMVASKAGRLSTVSLLLEKGADVTLQDWRRDEAIDYAKRVGHDAIVRILQQGQAAPPDH